MPPRRFTVAKNCLYCVSCFKLARDLCSDKESPELAIALYKLERQKLKLLDKSGWLARMNAPYINHCLECGQERRYADEDLDLYCV